MSSQYEAALFNVSTKTRQNQGILTSASNSEDSQRAEDVQQFRGKKRKRDEGSLEDLLKDPFVVRPYPQTGSSKPRSVQPLFLLPRSQLPLSSLDFAPSNALPRSRLFKAHIKILELEERMRSQPMVLIARLEDGRTFYAVERVDRGLYALCQLGSWADLKQLKASAVVARKESCNAPIEGIAVTKVPTTTPAARKHDQKKRLAIEALQSMVKRPSTSFEMKSQPVMTTEFEPAVPSERSLPDINETPTEEAAQQPTAEEIFENVRTQYFENLYLSKASLAYFAKGPLSRARAAFHLDFDSTLDMNDLISFLEGLVMSSTLLDKKYRDGVTGCVSEIDIHNHSADEAAATSVKSKKQKSSKKMKPGKMGLYPLEGSLIRKWWLGQTNDIEFGAPGASRDEITRKRVAQLRNRETQLQIIIILEVLALRPLVSATNNIEEGLPAAASTSLPTNEKQKSSKPKKPDQLNMLIDLHIDRLCIWQSIAVESASTTLADVHVSKEKPDASATIGNHADNHLRDFCVDVIVPFFSARLPDRCEIINRKLGGPIVDSPPKSRKVESISQAPSRPGAATKRPVPVKPRRTLKRVLTDERERRSMSRASSRPISLSRAATAPSGLDIKSEATESQSLSAIPAADSQANRGGILSRRYSRREVDFRSIAPGVNTKAKKQAMVEAELQEAISALKRPNRELAGKALAETAEKRSASVSQTRKSKKPIRNPLFQGIQITATPKVNRQKYSMLDSQPADLPKILEEADVAPIPTSSLSMIPQSATRPFRDSVKTRNPLYHSVQATPSKRPISAFGQLRDENCILGAVDYGGLPPSSPLHVRRSSAQLFLTVPESAAKVASKWPLPIEDQITPVKRKVQRLDHSHPYPSVEKENATTLAKDGARGAITPEHDSVYSLWDSIDEGIDGMA